MDSEELTLYSPSRGYSLLSSLDMKQTKTLVYHGMFVTLKDAFHIVGLSSLFSAVSMMCWTFYDIATQGYFILGENRLVVRYSECGLVGFSAIYMIYLLVTFVKKKAGT